MKIRTLFFISALGLASCSHQNNSSSTFQGNLPKPQISGGKPLMIALRDRATTRSFSEKELSAQQLANLLWAADGINRPAKTGRTAPSANNKQEIDLYVALKSGVFYYDYKNFALKKIINDDIRSVVGKQGFVKEAPACVLLVADYSKREGDKASSHYWAAVDAAYISQNIYLYCSSEDLATVVLGSANADSIAKRISLRNDQEVIFAQPVGFKENVK